MYRLDGRMYSAGVHYERTSRPLGILGLIALCTGYVKSIWNVRIQIGLTRGRKHLVIWRGE